MTTKEEIVETEMRERNEEPLFIWIEENRSDLQIEFIESFPPEDQPLDDDTPDLF